MIQKEGLGIPHLQVRELPEHIYQKIVAPAEAERRSIAQENIVLLGRVLQLNPQSQQRRQQLLSNLVQEAGGPPK